MYKTQEVRGFSLTDGINLKEIDYEQVFSSAMILRLKSIMIIVTGR